MAGAGTSRHMWRTLAIVLTVPFWGVACGGVVPVPKNEPRFLNGACPKGTEFIRARDVIEPAPPGYEIVAGQRKVLKEFAMGLRKEMGPSWRGYDAKVLIRRDKAEGTVVMVINAHEKTGGKNGFIAGAMQAEKAGDAEGRPLDFAGQEGRFQKTPDGGFLAMAPAGECSMILLIAGSEKLVLSGAKLLPPL